MKKKMTPETWGVTEIAAQIKIEPTFCAKRIIYIKKQFDENASEEITHSVEESYRVDYFLYIVDQAISSLNSRFEQFQKYEDFFFYLIYTSYILQMMIVRSLVVISLKNF